MKALLPLILASFLLSSCTKDRSKTFKLSNYELEGISIRAIEAIDENSMWFAGSNGKVGFTEDAGITWNINSISYDTLDLDFRGLAVTDEAVFVLSVASPALIYKSVDKGKNWEIIYKEDNPASFYNALTISSNGLGVAVGDPIDNCLSVIVSQNSGDSWEKISCDDLPLISEGEAGFAASNSNVNIIDANIWLVTGGARSRVYHSANSGETWSVYNTPIVQGGQMTGIFSGHFYDAEQGFIIGGDWNEKSKNTENKAITIDGGRTWDLIADGEGPSYRSSVRYVPGSNGNELVAVGTPGISHTKDGGVTWTKLSEESFYTIRFTKDGNSAWLAGPGKIAKMEW